MGPRYLVRAAGLELIKSDQGGPPAVPQGQRRDRLPQHHQVLHRGLPRAHQDHGQRDHPPQGASSPTSTTTPSSGSGASCAAARDRRPANASSCPCSRARPRPPTRRRIEHRSGGDHGSGVHRPHRRRSTQQSGPASAVPTVPGRSAGRAIPSRHRMPRSRTTSASRRTTSPSTRASSARSSSPASSAPARSTCSSIRSSSSSSSPTGGGSRTPSSSPCGPPPDRSCTGSRAGRRRTCRALRTASRMRSPTKPSTGPRRAAPRRSCDARDDRGRALAEGALAAHRGARADDRDHRGGDALPPAQSDGLRPVPHRQRRGDRGRKYRPISTPRTSPRTISQHAWPQVRRGPTRRQRTVEVTVTASCPRRHGRHGRVVRDREFDGTR